MLGANRKGKVASWRILPRCVPVHRRRQRGQGNVRIYKMSEVSVLGLLLRPEQIMRLLYVVMVLCTYIVVPPVLPTTFPPCVSRVVRPFFTVILKERGGVARAFHRRHAEPPFSFVILREPLATEESIISAFDSAVMDPSLRSG